MKVDCCICLEDFTGEGKIQTPSCGHLFHESCINDWMKNNESCPQCRVVIRCKELRSVYLTSTRSEDRRSSLFNSSLCVEYRHMNEDLLTRQDNLVKELEDLRQQLNELINWKTREMARHRKVLAENEMLKKKISELIKPEPGKPKLLRQQSADSYKNVESVVAKAWKNN